MASRKRIRPPKPRIPLPRKPPKVERDLRKEAQRRLCRRPMGRDANEE
jgi:hypothetical protein